jgi:hypothetical protein
MNSPIEVAAFLPRLYAGAIATGPEVVQEIASRLEEANYVFKDGGMSQSQKKVRTPNVILAAHIGQEVSNDGRLPTNRVPQ